MSDVSLERKRLRCSDVRAENSVFCCLLLLFLLLVRPPLIEHLVPSLENRIAEVIQPLKQDIIQLEDKIAETDMRTDDLEQYGY
jgi:hypothetical protein